MIHYSFIDLPVLRTDNSKSFIIKVLLQVEVSLNLLVTSDRCIRFVGIITLRKINI